MVGGKTPPGFREAVYSGQYVCDSCWNEAIDFTEDDELISHHH